MKSLALHTLVPSKIGSMGTLWAVLFDAFCRSVSKQLVPPGSSSSSNPKNVEPRPISSILDRMLVSSCRKTSNATRGT